MLKCYNVYRKRGFLLWVQVRNVIVPNFFYSERSQFLSRSLDHYSEDFYPKGRYSEIRNNNPSR